MSAQGAGDLASPAPDAGDRPAPVWLAVTVLVVLLLAMAAGGYMLRGVFSGNGNASPLDSEISKWEQQVAAAPDDVMARMQLANSYQRAQRYKDALGQYDRVLSADPGNTGALYDRGTVYLELGMDDRAEVAFWDVLELDKGHAAAAAALGRLYAGRGQYRSLIEAVRPAVELDPSAAELQYLMGLAYENLGRPDWAKARYELALKAAPDMKEARAALRRLEAQE